MTSTPVHERPGGRAVPPVQKPSISAATVVLVLVWLVGIVAGVLGPLLIVNGGAATASTTVSGGRLWAAFAAILVGIVIEVSACVLLYRRHRDPGVAVIAVVPFASLLIGGLAILGTKAPF